MTAPDYSVLGHAHNSDCKTSRWLLTMYFFFVREGERCHHRRGTMRAYLGSVPYAEPRSRFLPLRNKASGWLCKYLCPSSRREIREAEKLSSSWRRSCALESRMTRSVVFRVIPEVRLPVITLQDPHMIQDYTTTYIWSASLRAPATSTLRTAESLLTSSLE